MQVLGHIYRTRYCDVGLAFPAIPGSLVDTASGVCLCALSVPGQITLVTYQHVLFTLHGVALLAWDPPELLRVDCRYYTTGLLQLVVWSLLQLRSFLGEEPFYCFAQGHLAVAYSVPIRELLNKLLPACFVHLSCGEDRDLLGILGLIRI